MHEMQALPAFAATTNSAIQLARGGSEHTLTISGTASPILMPLKSGALIQADDTAVVHIVDDDASVRDGLEGLCESVGLAARCYATAREFLDASVADGPGCIILDIRLPDMNGLQFQAQLAEIGVRLPVVMITGHGDVPMSVRAMKQGAVDFLSKPFREQEMLDAVMTAIRTDRQRRAAANDVARLQERLGTLSAREQQVMLGVTAGKMNKQVAGDLGISEITVKIHRGAAMRKMGARTLADLVRMADVLNPSR